MDHMDPDLNLFGYISLDINLYQNFKGIQKLRPMSDFSRSGPLVIQAALSSIYLLRDLNEVFSLFFEW